MSNNQLNDLSKTYLEAVYGGAKKEEPKDTRLTVTAADKKANTKAYQNYKAGNKAYKAADHLKSEGYQRDPEQQEKERKTSKQTDPSKAGFTGIGNSIDDIMKQNAAMKKAAAKKAKKEELEFARHKASIISRGGRLEDAVESWNQKLAYREAMKNVSEKKEVNVNDTYKTVADLMHGEEKRWQDDDGDGKWYEKSDVDGKISKREKKAKKHNCASKVKHEEFGIGNPVKGMHDLDESGNVAHYDVMFGHGVEKNVPVSSLEILEGSMHEHVIHTEQKKSSKEKGLDGKACWDGYKLAGTKKKGGKTVDNCVKVKKESLSDWRTDLNDLIEIVAEPEEKAEKKVKESTVKNKVVINPKISEAIEEMGGEVLEHHSVDCDDDCEPNCEHDTIEEGKGKKNCGCGQDPCVTYGKKADAVEESYDEIDDDLLLFVESSLGNLPEDKILDMMESGWHRRNPGKKHPLESGSKKVTPRPVSDAEKKSTDKSDRMYVAMRRVKDRQKGYSKAKSDAADRLHSTYTSRQSKRKAGASSKEAAAQSPGDFGSKGFRIKRGGRSGKAPGTDRGTGNKAARRAGQEVKDRDPRKTRKEENFFSRFRNI